MKKTLLISLLVSTLVLLVACNSSTSSNSGNDTTTDPNATLTTEIKLLVGTLKLEGTDQVVTSDEAAELLPLWQAYLSLVTSQTAATEELNAVVKQIQSTMMPDQLEAIDAMDLTMEDQLTVMQSLGLGRNFGANGTPNPEGTPMAPGGMYPGGGDTGQVFIPGQGGDRPSFSPPEGGVIQGGGQGRNFPGGGTGGGNLDSSQIATLQAQGTPGFRGVGNNMLRPLIQAVIDLLQKKTTP